MLIPSWVYGSKLPREHLKKHQVSVQIQIYCNRILEVVVWEEMKAVIPSPPLGDPHVGHWAKVCGQAFGKHCIMECTLDKELRNLGFNQTSAIKLSETIHFTLTNFSLLTDDLHF